MATKKASAAPPAAGSETGISYEIIYFARAALRMLSDSGSDVASITIEHPDVEPLDDVVLRFHPPGLRLSVDLFDAEFRQIKASGKPDDVLDSADLVSGDSWLATKVSRTPLLKRVAERWRQFRDEGIRACLTLATTRHWRLHDPIGANGLDSDHRVSPRVFGDRHAQPLLRAWQNCADLTLDELREFAGSLRFETKTPSIQALEDEVAQAAAFLGLTPRRDTATIIDMFRKIFRGERRELDRNTLAALLGVRPSVRVMSIRAAATRSLRAYCGVSNAMPVDVGAVWGLQSGGFVGIIEGAAAAEVAEALSGASAVLDTVRRGMGRQWHLLESFHGRLAIHDLVAELRGTQPHGLVLSVADPEADTLTALRELVTQLRDAGHAAVIVAATSAANLVRSTLAQRQIECEALRLPRGTLPEAGVASAGLLTILKNGTRGELLDLDPGKTATLLTQASRHKTAAVRHAGLALASAADVWLDRWLDLQVALDGAELLAACSDPDPRFDAYADDVALAVMRLARRTPSRRAEAPAALMELERIVSEPVQKTIRVWLENGLGAFRNAATGVQLLLLRGGVDADLLWSAVETDPRVVQCVPPSPARLQSLLSLGTAERATVGLCTAAEWLDILEDSETGDAVRDRRYARPLPHIPPHKDPA